MQTLKLSVEKKESQEVEIPVPCFMRNKSETEYIGVLDEKTVVTIYDNGTYRSLVNCELWVKQHDVAKAWNEWGGCTESEFLTKYDEVVEAMSLHPRLAV